MGVDGGLHGGAHLAAVGDVDDRVTGYRVGHGGQAVGVDVPGDDLRAGGLEMRGDGPPNAFDGTGDDGGSTGQINAIHGIGSAL